MELLSFVHCLDPASSQHPGMHPGFMQTPGLMGFAPGVPGPRPMFPNVSVLTQKLRMLRESQFVVAHKRNQLILDVLCT